MAIGELDSDSDIETESQNTIQTSIPDSESDISDEDDNDLPTWTSTAPHNTYSAFQFTGGFPGPLQELGNCILYEPEISNLTLSSSISTQSQSLLPPPNPNFIMSSSNSQLIQSPMYPVPTTHKTRSLPYMAPSSIHTATFDFNRILKETERIDKRKLKDSKRTQRSCTCMQNDCPGIYFIFGDFKKKLIYWGYILTDHADKLSKHSATNNTTLHSKNIYTPPQTTPPLTPL